MFLGLFLGHSVAKANQKALIRGTWGLSVDLQEIPQGTGSGFLWDKEMNSSVLFFFEKMNQKLMLGTSEANFSQGPGGYP